MNFRFFTMGYLYDGHLIQSLPQAIRKYIEGMISAPQVIVFEEDDSYSYLLMTKVRGKIACDNRLLHTS